MDLKMRKLFYYSKTDRRLLFAAFGLLLLIVALRIVLPSQPKSRSEEAEELSAFQQEMEAQKGRKKYGPSARYGKYGTQKYSRYNGARRTPFTLAALNLHPFNPNQADSTELAAMGLPTSAVRSLVHYREKGGQFRTVESLQRLYGMSDSLYQCLRPYIQLPAPRNSAYPIASAHSASRDSLPALAYTPAEKYPAGTVVDLNTADTTELKKIPGIGSGIARAIVNYRERLGGFYAVAQLADVRYTTPEMQQWFKVSQPALRPIRVNHDKLDRLRAHPYLNYYQARDILAERSARGDIKSLSRLSLYKDFTEKDFERLKPYLDFD
jgi:competence ComEA-like helix-hairpin-helix protein